ncbi:pentapeptide repeat-containing protein [Rubidibacter lacunae]|uniref:pentapeptide repeat-containing protein n=1 Tax=Rubidibacter lacunae TaxID=582514 RepID=UPI0003F7EDA2|nr:pentapeptide repeat-containing protein [Rubidibacter lacunae]
MASHTKAKDVLRQYAAGERNFRCLSLRGESFKNADLSGADFSKADIRGANFSEAKLCGANFTRAKAGLQRRWVVGLLAIVFTLAALAVILFLFMALLIAYSGKAYALSYSGVALAAFVAIALAGFQTAHYTIFVAAAVSIAVSGAVALSVVVAGAVIAGIVFTVTLTGAITGGETGGIVVKSFTVFFAAVAYSGIGALGGWLAVARNYRTLKRIRHAASFVWCIGGTNFHEADLTDVNFTGATLKSTNIDEAVIARTCWKDARKLHLARSGPSILG